MYCVYVMYVCMSVFYVSMYVMYVILRNVFMAVCGVSMIYDVGKTFDVCVLCDVCMQRYV